MAYKIELLPEAETDIDDIYSWYNTINPKLAKRFLESTEEVLSLIQSHPLLFQKIKRNYRKSNLKTFPYKIVYRIKENIVVVIAVVHHKRHPGLLTKRR